MDSAANQIVAGRREGDLWLASLFLVRLVDPHDMSSTHSSSLQFYLVTYLNVCCRRVDVNFAQGQARSPHARYSYIQ